MHSAILRSNDFRQRERLKMLTAPMQGNVSGNFPSIALQVATLPRSIL
jgi:hypothetical protein